jgi:hypothetical protein
VPVDLLLQFSVLDALHRGGDTRSSSAFCSFFLSFLTGASAILKNI